MADAVEKQGEADIKQGEAKAAGNTNVSATSAEVKPTSAETKQTSNTPDPTEQLRKLTSDLKTLQSREAKAREEAKALRDEITKRDREREDAELDSAVNELPEDQREKRKTNLKTVTDRIRTDRQQLNDLMSKYSPVLAVLEELGITDAQSIKDTITKARTTQFDMTISTIAERNNVSADVLKDKAAKLKVTDEAGIEELASFMPKKIAPAVTDSGKGAGGGVDTSNMSSRELISHGLKNNK